MKNVVVKVTSEEHGAEVIKAFKDLGVDVKWADGDLVGYYYGLFNGEFDCNSNPRSSQVITLEELKAMAKPYPKMMWVWDEDGDTPQKREVIGEIQSHGIKYYITHYVGDDFPTCWRNAEDIEEPTKMKTPIQELIDWLNKNGDLRLYGGREKTIHEITLKMRSMLEKEKEVIMNAYTAGESDGKHEINSALNYFNQTFNTKEK